MLAHSRLETDGRRIYLANTLELQAIRTCRSLVNMVHHHHVDSSITVDINAAHAYTIAVSGETWIQRDIDCRDISR